MMEPNEIRIWLQVAIALPAMFVAYRIPKVLSWMKTKIATVMAAAVTAQLMPHLTTMQEDIAEVRKQVFPNGGGSMNDKLTKVLQTANRTEHQVTVLHATVRAHQDADLDHARFEADASGLFGWVSHAFLRWCNRGIDQVMGHGWINCVAMADRERVRAEWNDAIEQAREFSSRFRMRAVTGEEFEVEAYAKPIWTPGSEEAHRWVGVISRLA